MVAAAIPSGQLRLSRTYPGITISSVLRPYPVSPLLLGDHRQWLLQQSSIINGLMAGKSNNTGVVTLTASSATTTVTLSEGRLGPNTLPILVPLTASAATEAGSLYVSARDPANNTFTLTHVNSATADRKFGFVLVG